MITKYLELIYLIILLLPVITSFLLMLKIIQFNQHFSRIKQLSYAFLFIHFLILWVIEIIATQFANSGVTNGYIYTIHDAVNTPFLFGFFAIQSGKKSVGFALAICYLIILYSCIFGNHFSPDVAIDWKHGMLLFSCNFIAALIFVSSQLVEHWEKRNTSNLKLGIAFMIAYFFANVITVLTLNEISIYLLGDYTIIVCHYSFWMLFYLFCGWLFFQQFKKLKNG